MRRSPYYVCAFLFLSLAAASSQAATYTVTNNFDSGGGSLRDAVNRANSTREDDRIVFNIKDCAPPKGCEITNYSSELIVTGDGGKLEIDNSDGVSPLYVRTTRNDWRLFHLIGNAQATIKNVILEGGGGRGADGKFDCGGGAILVESGKLFLENVTVQLNTANREPSSSPGRSTSLSDCGGGGIYVMYNAAATLTDSTVSENGSQFGGGGIFNHGGTLTIVNSTVARNSSARNGGGILSKTAAVWRGGTEWDYYPAKTFLTNTTVSSNKAAVSGGGISAESYNDQSQFVMTNSTVVYNSLTDGSGTGGGMQLAKNSVGNIDRMKMRNSIVFYNSAPRGNPNINGYFRSGGTNLFERNTPRILYQNLGEDDQPNSTDIEIADAKIGALADNGGATRTHALLPGSPAIAAGNRCVTLQNCPIFNDWFALVTDQRGVARANRNAVDIGAVERKDGDPTTQSTTPSNAAPVKSSKSARRAARK